MNTTYLSPAASFGIGFGVILASMAALVVVFLLLAHFDPPRPRMEWFGLGCMFAVGTTLAVFFSLAENLIKP